MAYGLAESGKILVHCHANKGCTLKDIVNSLGLTIRDLSPASLRTGTLGKIVATYDYVDENGKLLYQAVRYSPKDFRQRRPDGKGGWIWKGGINKVPYRLPDILNAPKDTPIFIVEGEKDADRLASLGLVATTNVGGAGKWNRKLKKYFAGRQVIIIPDNDQAGRNHAKKVRKELSL